MTLADRVVRGPHGPVDLAVLPTGIRDVVTIRGSVDTIPDFGSGGELIQDWLVSTLDKGTLTRDRFEVARILEDLGARIGFSGSNARVRFSARCLRADVEKVTRLLAEQLLSPALDVEELEKTRDRLQASIQRSRSDAGYRAGAGLFGAVFEEAHPNHMRTPEAEQALLRDADAADPGRFHAHQLAAPAMRLVFVGDVDPAEVAAFVERAATHDPAPSATAPEWDHAGPGNARTIRIPIPDRDNIEVRWGHGVAVKQNDPEYLALRMGSFILGGNFSARLMAEIRDRRGLTYGIGSSLWGVDPRYSGMWRVHVTLSRERLEEGIEATESLLADYVSDGATSDELAEMQETLAGSHQVRLATTGGLAGSILGKMEADRPLSEIDTYPERVRALRLEDVNGAIRAHMHPERLVRCIAGSLPE